MGVFIKLKQRFCKHNYKKHYSTTEGGYVLRCTKCDKVVYSWKF